MKLNLLLPFIFLVGCAHGKMGTVSQKMETGSISPDQTISVEAVSARDASFTGDKSGVAATTDHEKTEIESRYAAAIADQLVKKGFKAQAIEGQARHGLVLHGVVTKVEHGSAAARMLVGMGAGSSNLYTTFVLTDLDSKKPLAKFEVIATSGATSGAGSYMDAHIKDGAIKTAEYLAQANGNTKN